MHQIVLSWLSGSGDVSFNVLRGNKTGGPYTKINPSPVPVSTQINGQGGTFTDTNVASGSAFFYVVTGVDSAGVESSQSNEASATVPGPAAPTQLTASAS